MSRYSCPPDSLSSFETYLARVLSQCTRIPQHVALVGDGNRRWARERGFEPWHGQSAGLDKYIKVTNFLQKLGCPEVTLFLFSVDNFKRAEREVVEVLRLCEDAVDIFSRQSAQLKARIRLIGDKKLLPLSLQLKIENAEKSTAFHAEFTLNLAIAYSSRLEITQSICRILRSPDIATEDISEELLRQHLSTGACRPVDLLIRTSGETRLSDFYLWETAEAVIIFLTTNWPDTSCWRIAQCILKYQRSLSVRPITKLP